MQQWGGQMKTPLQMGNSFHKIQHLKKKPISNSVKYHKSTVNYYMSNAILSPK